MAGSTAKSQAVVDLRTARAPHDSPPGSRKRSLREQSLGELLSIILSPCYAELGRSRSEPEEPPLWSLNDIHEMLQRKLQWYGWHSVEIGPFVLLGDNVLVTLMRNGKVHRRVRVDRRTGAVRLRRDAVIQLDPVVPRKRYAAPKRLAVPWL